MFACANLGHVEVKGPYIALSPALKG